MEEGIVKWLDDRKDYGFIECPESEDIFVHYTAIQEFGHRTLRRGVLVRIEIVGSEQGPQASNVHRV